MLYTTKAPQDQVSLPRQFFRMAKDSVSLAVGICQFLATQRNSEKAFQAMLRLHSMTNGRSSELLSRFFSWTNASREREFQDILRGTLSSHFPDEPGIDAKLADSIRRDGYVVLPWKLDGKVCDELLSFAKSTPANAFSPKGELLRRAPFSLDDKEVGRYHFLAEDLVKVPAVQSLLLDRLFIGTARQYFQGIPQIDSVTMWSSHARGTPANEEFAQLFHFDFDRPKWLKVFIYLTDVDTDTGPHVYAKGSHLPEPKRGEILRRGYVRIPDEDVNRLYPGSVAEIAGPKGTVLIEDTAGFHKGKALNKGYRVLFEIQLCLSRFGVTYQRVPVPASMSTQLREIQTRTPWMCPIFR